MTRRSSPRRTVALLLAAGMATGAGVAAEARGANRERRPIEDLGRAQQLAPAIPASANVEVLGNLPLCGLGTCADVWGRGELAMVALTEEGWALVDTSHPRSPRRIATVTGLVTRDVKISASGTLAVATSETGGLGVGAVLYDVSNPFSPRELSRITHPAALSVHNAFLHEGFLYLASNNSRRVEIFDVRRPQAPVHVASVADPNGRIHDMAVVDRRLYSSFLNGGFTVHDVTDPRVPLLLASHDYPDAFTHNAWPSEDGRFLFTTDEVAPGGHMRVWDLGDAGGGVGPVRQVGRFVSTEPAVIHNVHTLGSLVYIAYYSAGLRIADVSEPRLPVEVAFADTSPARTQDFQGAWGVFPYTGSSTVYVSDRSTGLWIVDFNGQIASAPTGFAARATLDRGALVARTVVELSWDRHPAAAGYRIYRADAQGILTPAGTVGSEASRFVESLEPLDALEYAVTAVLPDGTESRPTPIVTVRGGL
jgi:choice-of-anchor B domain-containing protein